MPGLPLIGGRQKATAEQWLRRAIMLLILAAMVLGVALPVWSIVDRSIHAEFNASIWGPQEVRIGGRIIRLEDGAMHVDDTVVPVVDGVAEGAGVHATIEDGAFRTVTCAEVRYDGAPKRIDPITVTLDGDRWIIDGVELSPDAYQRPVERGIGLALYREYFSKDALYGSLFNSLYIASVSAVLSTSLAFAYAFALTRSAMPGKAVFRVVAMLPLFAPTMLYGLSLVYLFGNQGLITKGFFGALPWLALDIPLRGPVGIIIAETVFTFPPALVILLVAFANMDARLDEAASVLGASWLRRFLTVTVPNVRFGLINAFIVGFTLAFTDFGAPKTIGGHYNVLAVDIYKQVVGQQNFGMGAVVSIVLLVPAVGAFIVQRVLLRRQDSAVSARSVPFTPKRHWPSDLAALAYCSLVALFILAMLFTAGFASVIRQWPYDFALTVEHYRFEGVGGGGYEAFWNSVRMAAWIALFGTVLAFTSAYLVEKTRGLQLLRQATYVLSIVPLALPGLVIGIAYIFFFNEPYISVPFAGAFPNPLNALYGTMAILVIANVIHFYTVSYLTASTALRQLDKEFEAVSESMAVPFYRTFLRVTAPVCLPAILEIAAFFFVNGMATVSAVIFLYSADTRLASVAVVNMDDAGDIAPAAAMCMLIVFANILVRSAFEALGWWLKRRTEAWRTR